MRPTVHAGVAASFLALVHAHDVGTCDVARSSSYYQTVLPALAAKGYTFTSTSAKMFIEEGRVEGIDPLSGRGPLGDVRSDTYEIVDEGDRVLLSGRVQMTIIPGGRDGAGTEAGTDAGDEELGGEN